jgi:hypothetical protein
MSPAYCEPTPPCPAPPCPRFKLEAVIVCAFYSDFLRETLPHNKQMFDKIVVVTSPEDKATQLICEWNHVECVVTDVLNTRWDKFCKGAGVNAGLEKLDKDAWVVHLDADIWLPPLTRILLEQAHLDPAMLYGIDRFNVLGYELWREFIETPKLQQEDRGWVHLQAFPMGTRVTADSGYVPIGFFQMWNPAVSGDSSYPEGHETAGREDYLFATRWPRSRRHLLPEVVGYHLESESAVMGANWKGRKTKIFGHAHTS